MTDKTRIKTLIKDGKAVMGMELGSTRIKAVLMDDVGNTIATGTYNWENKLVEGIWTYDLDEVKKGVRECYTDLTNNVMNTYDTVIINLAAIGFSAMMHGYLVFDKNDNQLVPFRTWRNTMTSQASKSLTELFGYKVPQRWSIAHLYQAMLNGEKHISKVDFMTTLSGYVHWLMTDKKVIGIGDASGMFPIDSDALTYNRDMINKFNSVADEYCAGFSLEKVLPDVLVAGKEAGRLTKEGAALLDSSNNLQAGIPICPPEGDAGTGMVATNSIRQRTGNISAGTSIFAMIVLEKVLSKVYPEIDMVTTPAGPQVAMVHCNNCTSDLNAWVMLFNEFAEAVGIELSMDQLFKTLYNKALEGDLNCGGLLAYNYFSGEHITGFEEGRPLFVRKADKPFNLANFMKVHLYTAIGALKVGMDILTDKESVKVDSILGHGGFFKTECVGQSIMASALNIPVSVMSTAGEGGAWGIAILASYMLRAKKGITLEDYLDNTVFKVIDVTTMNPDSNHVKDFRKFMESYVGGLAIEATAIECLK